MFSCLCDAQRCVKLNLRHSLVLASINRPPVITVDHHPGKMQHLRIRSIDVIILSVAMYSELI